MSEAIKFLIGADILPNEENVLLFTDGIAENLVGKELASKLFSSDFRIYNLEGALTDVRTPILKSGPVLSAEVKTINGIKALMPDLLVLSNNHILDEGQIGVENTIAALKMNSIPFIGIGRTEFERRTPFIFEKNGIKVGIYNCCEHEFSVVDEGLWGANPYDPLYAFDDVKALKQNCDFVIVLYHGGKEYFRYPSPQLQRVFRKFADTGADVVIAQHTHCIGSAEEYNGSILVYGQGNFLFDTEESEYENTSLLVSLAFTKNKSVIYDYIPICKNKYLTRLATDNEKKEILISFNERSAKLKDTSFLKNEYKKKASDYLKGYLLNMHIGSKLDTIIIRLYLKLPLQVRKKIFKKTLTKLLATKNYISCEAHRELLIEGLNNLL